jgi:hypothetical protein
MPLNPSNNFVYILSIRKNLSETKKTDVFLSFCFLTHLIKSTRDKPEEHTESPDNGAQTQHLERNKTL